MCPQDALKLDEGSICPNFVKIGNEPLVRSLERAAKLKRLSGSLQRKLRSLLEPMPGLRIQRLMLDTLDANAQSIQALNSIGLWAAFRAGCKAGNVDPLSLVLIDHCVEVEEASCTADALLAAGSYAEAAQHIGSNPALQDYFQVGALRRLAGATSQSEALSPRAAGWCEFMLAQVARMDLAFMDAGRKDANEDFSHLLDFDTQSPCKPGSALVRWLKGQFAVTSLHALLGLDHSNCIDESTLKRWSSGREFPSQKTLGSFVRSIASTLPEDRRSQLLDEAGAHAWAARRLNKILEVAEWLFHLVAEDRLASPPFLVGNSASQWARQRYTFWLQHWRARKLSS